MKNTVLISLLIVFFSCKKSIDPVSPDKLFEKYQDAVVLITNQYYYEIKIDNSILFYSPQSQHKIFFSQEEVLENLSILTGSGFVVASNGKIITNRHVVSPKADGYKEELTAVFDGYVNDSRKLVVQYTDSLNTVFTYYNENENRLEEDVKSELNNKYDSYTQSREFYFNIYSTFKNIDLDNSEIRLVVHKLAVAYNNTHITELDDLQECVLLKESMDDNVDLALIQTKTQIFNKKPSNIFNFIDNNPNVSRNPKEYKERDINNPAKINDEVYMIGFNHGFSLASTKNGIKSQFTTGTISQESDGERILYTIPTLEGSSGSPIIDKWGNLVAVNFAKVSNTQSFSFGVPLKEVIKFYEE